MSACPSLPRSAILWTTLAMIASAPIAAATPAAEPVRLAANDRVVCWGDSVTAGGSSANGYVSRLDQAIQEQRPELHVTVVGRGVPNHTAKNLLSRRREIMEPPATVVVVYIGLNDVKDSTLDEYRQRLREIVGLIRGQNARALLCTPTVRLAKNEAELDQRLVEFAAGVRSLGAELAVPVVDLRRRFEERLASLAEDARRRALTQDGVHLNPAGNQLAAAAILEALGLRAEWTTVGVVVDVPRREPTGTVVADPPARWVPPGTRVTLRAEPAAGAAFAGWEGAVTGTDNPVSLVPTGNVDVRARFVATGSPPPQR